MTDFTSRVLSTVRRIPPGRVATYGDVAEIAGRPGAARAVGNIMRDCKARDVPCHRVVAAAGRLGGYGGETGAQALPAAGRGHRRPGHANQGFCPLPMGAGTNFPAPRHVNQRP